MDKDTTDDILKRLGRLERRSARVRIGVVTADSPLTVSLGAAAVPVEDLTKLESATPAVNDKVAVLVYGNSRLVLGVLS